MTQQEAIRNLLITGLVILVGIPLYAEFARKHPKLAGLLVIFPPPGPL